MAQVRFLIIGECRYRSRIFGQFVTRRGVGDQRRTGRGVRATTWQEGKGTHAKASAHRV